MKNTISVDITLRRPGTVEIFHNNELLELIESSGTYYYDISTNYLNNKFLLRPQTLIKVNQLLMFGLGEDKLVYCGICKNNLVEYQSQDVDSGVDWQIDYQMPVFTWLHHQLHFGWLVGE